MKSFSFIFFCLLLSWVSNANNVALSNISVVNNAGNTGKIIEFDVSWDNSWRTASTGNYDGVWIFFKFKDNDGKWYPLRFNGNNINMPAGVSYNLGNNGGNIGIGMFLYRSNLGSGTFTITDARAGIQSYPGTFDIRGYAIEMVYVPQGSFWVGDGLSAFSYQAGQATNVPYQVTGNGSSVSTGTAAGLLYDPHNSLAGNLSGYPTGYSAFWMMKYELSQGGYRDFLNTLTYQQQVNRLISTVSPASSTGTNIHPTGTTRRQYIEIATSGNSGSNLPAVMGCDADGDNIFNEATDGEWITTSLLTWPDVASYLDWAGLRPMTELEYEKACRGPLTAVDGEFAWGNDNIADYPYFIGNAGLASEFITNASSFSGNALNDSSVIGFIRGGIFATASSTRISSGAGYYGAMELSGSNYELCITTANVAGRAYNGKHGDGILTTGGNANENYWPGVNGTTTTGASPGAYDGGLGVRSNGGLMNKGGSLFDVSRLRISDRTQAVIYDGMVLITNTSSKTYFAIRGVRDAN